MDRLEPEPAANEQRYVSTAQVAHALGVSVTTVKRWVDDGILPAHRTAGGHRKLLMSDVLRLVREGNLPQADLSRLLPKSTQLQTDPRLLYRQLNDAIRKSDFELTRSVLHGAYQAGLSIELISDQILAPALMDLGHLWATGRIDVMQEHRVMQVVISALYELRSFLRLNADSTRPVAVGGAPEHDHYVVPSLLAKLTLLDNGWDAINLGPHTPLEAFLSAIRDIRPQLIWMTISHLENQNEFLNHYRQLYMACQENGIPIIIGGRGLPDSLRSKMPYTSYGDGMTQLAAFAQSLYRRPRRPKRGRPLGSTSKAKDPQFPSDHDELLKGDTPREDATDDGPMDLVEPTETMAATGLMESAEHLHESSARENWAGQDASTQNSSCEQPPTRLRPEPPGESALS